MSDVTPHHSGSEWEHILRLDQIPTDTVLLEANPTQRQALAERFGLEEISALSVKVALDLDGVTVTATGTLKAEFEQLCAISGEPFANSVEEDLALKFVPESAQTIGPDEEIELEETDLDEITYSGKSLDLGEALAQSFGLAIDPYAEGPDADAARNSGLIGSEEASGPFAALAQLKKS